MTRLKIALALPFALYTVQLAACGDDDEKPAADAGRRDASLPDEADDERDAGGGGGEEDELDADTPSDERDAGDEDFALTCAEYLQCVCGSADAQGDDSADCTAKRGVIDALREQAGDSASDAYCTQQIKLLPAAAADCDIDLPGASADQCDALITCQCPALAASDADSEACKANRATAEEFRSLDAGSACGTVLEALTCTGASDGGVPADGGGDEDVCVAVDQAQAAAESALGNALAQEITNYNECTFNSQCAIVTFTLTCEGRDVIVPTTQAIAIADQAAYLARGAQLGTPYCNSVSVRPTQCPSDDAQPASTAQCTSGRCVKVPAP